MNRQATINGPGGTGRALNQSLDPVLAEQKEQSILELQKMESCLNDISDIREGGPFFWTAEAIGKEWCAEGVTVRSLRDCCWKGNAVCDNVSFKKVSRPVVAPNGCNILRGFAKNVLE